MVQQRGICMFHSELFGEPVAFARGESYGVFVGRGVVVYTEEELRLLYPEGVESIDPKALKAIHLAKKLGGGRVTAA